MRWGVASEFSSQKARGFRLASHSGLPAAVWSAPLWGDPRVVAGQPVAAPAELTAASPASLIFSCFYYVDMTYFYILTFYSCFPAG